MLSGLDQWCLESEGEIESFIQSDGKGEVFHQLQSYAIFFRSQYFFSDVSGLTDEEMNSVQ